MYLKDSFKILWHLQFLIIVHLSINIKCLGGSDVFTDVKEDATNSFRNQITSKVIETGANECHVIKVENASDESESSDPITFLLIGNKLKLVHANTDIDVETIADLVDPNQTNLSFDSIQAVKWQTYFIMIASVNGGNYNIYIFQLNGKNRMLNLLPIQFLSRYGHPKTLSTFVYEKVIYCLIGSNYIEENRSELRIFKWQQSYFQIIETIVNQHHNIGTVIVVPTNQIILITDAIQVNDTDTIVQVHRYKRIIDTDDDDDDNNTLGSTMELQTKRIQNIIVPYSLQVNSLIPYSDKQSKRSYLITCNGNVMKAMLDGMCTTYVWKENVKAKGYDISNDFNELNLFEQYLKSLNLTDVHESDRIDSRNGLITIQNHKTIVAFLPHTKDMVNIDFKATNLSSSYISVSKHPESKQLLYQLICLTRNFDTQLVLNGITLFHESLRVDDNLLKNSGDKTLTSASKLITFESQIDKINRMHMQLNELKAQLKGELDKYSTVIKNQIAKILATNAIRKSLKNDDSMFSNQEIIADRVEIIAAKESSVKNIVINTDIKTKRIVTLFDRLKEMKHKTAVKLEAEQNINRKRSPEVKGKIAEWTGETMNIERLYAPAEEKFYTETNQDASNNQNGNLFSGNVVTKFLKTRKVSIQNHPNTTEDQTLIKDFVRTKAPVSSDRHHNEIIVKTINGLDWDNFVASLYRKRKNIVVTGDLILSQPTSIKSLETNFINQMPVNDFMTLSTAQRIESSIYVSKIHTTQIDAQTVNQIEDFANVVALIGRDNVIETPVKLSTCNVSNTLILSDKEGRKMTNNIVGTRLEDLMQIYNKPVRIQGSLTVQDISVLSAADRQEMNVWINDFKFDFDSIPENFWMKSVDQKLGNCFFTQQCQTPQLFTQTIDMHPALDFLFLKQKEPFKRNHFPMSLLFQGAVQIAGDLNTDESVKTSLQRLDSEAVSRFEKSHIVLSSSLTFKDKLIVDHIAVSLDIEDLVLKSDDKEKDSLFKAGVSKTISKQLIIEKDLTISSEYTASLRIGELNDNGNLDKQLASIIRNDQQQYQNGVFIFDNDLSALNVTVNQFIDNSGSKDYQHDSYFDINSMLWELASIEKPKIRFLQINGNVTFKSYKWNDEKDKKPPTLNIYRINDVKTTEYLQLLILNRQHSLTDPYGSKRPSIGGIKYFTSDLIVEFDLKTRVINRKVYVHEWMEDTLRKQLHGTKPSTQIISGANWKFESFSAENIEITNELNGVKIKSNNYEMADIIFITNDASYPIDITSNIVFSHPNGIEIGIYADLSGVYVKPCDVRELFASLNDMKHESWNYIQIFGKCYISEVIYDESVSKLYLSTLFKNVVLADVTQTISSNVVFKCRSSDVIGIGEITKYDFNPETQIGQKISGIPLISDMNLLDIFNDAIIKGVSKSAHVIISGKKVFLKDNVECFDQVIVINNVNTAFINDVDIGTFNQTIIRRNTNILDFSLQEKLIFNEPLTVSKIIIHKNHTINGVHENDIFFIYKPLLLQPLVFTTKSRIFISKSLEVRLINDVSFEFFILNRVRKYRRAADPEEPQTVAGYISFENLVVHGNQSFIDTINDIPINDIVFLDATEVQEITGRKHIKGGSLYVYQPISIWKINGVELMDTYTTTVFRNQNQSLDQLTVVSPYSIEVLNDLLIYNKANNIRIAGVSSGYRNKEQEILSSTNEKIEINSTKPKQMKLNFVDISNDFKITFNSSNEDLEIDSMINSGQSNWITIETLSHSVKHFSNDNRSESLCPVQYHIWPSKNLLVYRSRPFSRLLTVHLQSNNIIHVKTIYPFNKNYYNCEHLSEPPQTSNIRSILYVNYQETLRFENGIVESINVFYTQDGNIYLILHIYREHVLILRNKLATMTKPWDMLQKIPLEFNRNDGIQDSVDPAAFIFNVRLILWRDSNVLIIARSSALSFETPLLDDTTAHNVAYLYQFNRSSEQFNKYSAINGDFNIISSIEIPTNHKPETELYLILGKQETDSIDIFKAFVGTDELMKFQPQQKLWFEAGIQTISMFSEYGKMYLGIINKHGQFHIYQYQRNKLGRQSLITASDSININSIKSQWQSILSGHFDGANALVPFVFNRKLYLFLLGTNENHQLHDINNKLNNINAKVITLYYY